MTSLKDLRLYTTNSHDCSYLPGQQAKTLFIDPEFIVTSDFHTHLSELGFRRSGNHIYRPHCDECQQCIPCRIVCSEFIPNKRFKRILNKNKDLTITNVDSIDSEEYFQLYKDYINTRHNDGDMYPATREQYESFLIKGFESSQFYSIRLDEKLLGVMISDHLDNALSAVFTFYDVNYAKRSLGNFAVLWQVAHAQRTNLRYVYLGYWIKECSKMNYKTLFRPLEMLVDRRWIKLK